MNFMKLCKTKKKLIIIIIILEIFDTIKCVFIAENFKTSKYLAEKLWSLVIKILVI